VESPLASAAAAVRGFTGSEAVESPPAGAAPAAFEGAPRGGQEGPGLWRGARPASCMPYSHPVSSLAARPARRAGVAAMSGQRQEGASVACMEWIADWFPFTVEEIAYAFREAGALQMTRCVLLPHFPRTSGAPPLRANTP
jgi:hypothetical protein